MICQVFAVRTNTQMDSSLWSKGIALLPQQMADHVGRYRRWQDRQNALAGKLLTRYAFVDSHPSGDVLDLLESTDYGRPFLEGQQDFNISHCDGMVLLARTEAGRVGIDVEKKRSIPLEDFRDYFSGDEWKRILSDPQPSSQFLRLWTLKESVIKADGRGLGVDLLAVQEKDQKVVLEGQVYHVQKIDVGQDFFAHVACTGPLTEVTITWIKNIEELIR